MSTSYTRVGLTAREAAWVLLLSEAQVRYRLRTGVLEYALRPRLITVESVRRLFPDDPLLPVRERVLERLLRGEVEPPPLRSRYVRDSYQTLIAATLQYYPARGWPSWL